MALHFNRYSLAAAGITVIILLTVQSCRETPPKTDLPAQQKETSRHLIDSLLPLCRSTFDSARKDLKRKDILVRGQQLMKQTERLSEAAQYKLDTLAKVVELQARATRESDINRDDKYLQTLVDLLDFQRSKFPVNISVTAFSIGGHYQRAHNDTMASKYYTEAIENLPNSHISPFRLLRAGRLYIL